MKSWFISFVIWLNFDTELRIPKLISLENKNCVLTIIIIWLLLLKMKPDGIITNPLQFCNNIVLIAVHMKKTSLLVSLFYWNSWNPTRWIKIVESLWCLGNLCAVAWRLLVSWFNHIEKEQKCDKNGPCWCLKSPWDSMSIQNTKQFPPQVICF